MAKTSHIVLKPAKADHKKVAVKKGASAALASLGKPGKDGVIDLTPGYGGKATAHAVQVMDFTKETPGTFVFSNPDEKAHIPTLYIKKGFFKSGKPPAQIRIAVEIV